jgi:acyl-coenzyme A thioesterase PaaI-like protein
MIISSLNKSDPSGYKQPKQVNPMQALELFNKLKGLPAGTLLFTKAICLKAPYFASIHPLVEELKPSYARVTLRKRRSVENHIKTVHAIAMCNMAELAGGLMTDVSIPKGARWIPAGMTVKYVKKAQTDLVAVADGSQIDWTQEGMIVVPVRVTDTANDLVFTADITMSVKQAKS